MSAPRRRLAPKAPPLAGADAEIVTRWEAWQLVTGKSETTRIKRRLTLTRLRAVVGRPLLEVTGADLANWQMSLADQTLQSIATYTTCVRSFYAWAFRHGHVAANPAVLLDQPRVPKGRPHPIAPADLATALAAADPRLRAMLGLMALCGLRCAEVAHLERRHVADGASPPYLSVELSKGGRSRVVPLPTVALELLRGYGMPASGPLFWGVSGRRLTANNVSKIVSLHMHELGIPAAAHSLRHYFGCVSYQDTLDLRLVQEMLGHSSPHTTQVYATFANDAPAALARALDVRGRALLGQPEPDPQPAAAAEAIQVESARSGLRLLAGGGGAR